MGFSCLKSITHPAFSSWTGFHFFLLSHLFQSANTDTLQISENMWHFLQILDYHFCDLKIPDQITRCYCGTWKFPGLKVAHYSTAHFPHPSPLLFWKPHVTQVLVCHTDHCILSTQQWLTHSIQGIQCLWMQLGILPSNLPWGLCKGWSFFQAAGGPEGYSTSFQLLAYMEPSLR